MHTCLSFCRLRSPEGHNLQESLSITSASKISLVPAQTPNSTCGIQSCQLIHGKPVIQHLFYSKMITNFHIHKCAVLSCPGLLQYLKYSQSGTIHDVHFTSLNLKPPAIKPSFNHLFFRPLWVIVSIILREFEQISCLIWHFLP